MLNICSALQNFVFGGFLQAKAKLPRTNFFLVFLFFLWDTAKKRIEFSLKCLLRFSDYNTITE